LVGNRIRNQEDVSFIEQESGELPLLGTLPDDPGVIEADRRGRSVYALVPSLKEAAGRIADQLDKQPHTSKKSS
jgi:CO dehydrogenase nickel-insertion accessory protein CooC1